MRSNASRAVGATAAVALAIAACSTDSSQPSESGEPASAAPTSAGADELPEVFGNAEVSPSVVSANDTFQVRPSDLIQPICGGFAEVYVAVPDRGLEFYAQLGGDGLLALRSETVPTWPPCQPPESSEAVTFTTPTGLDAGRYVICVAWDLHPDGCGGIAVVPES